MTLRLKQPRALQASLREYLERVTAISREAILQHEMMSAQPIVAPRSGGSHGAPPDRAYGCYEALVLDRGRLWQSAPLDRRARRGRVKYCYLNSLLLTEQFPFLRYAEGYAIGSVDGESYVAVQHSWAVDRRDRVWDATWPEPESSAYFGMVFTREEVARFIDMDEETFGILPTEYRIGAPLLKYGRLFPDEEEVARG